MKNLNVPTPLLSTLEYSIAQFKFYSFLFSANPFATSSLKEHGDHELCTDPLDEFSVGHRLEKRSYLPPVTCTRTHELNAVRSKVHCSPRLRLIRLPWPNDTSIHKVSDFKKGVTKNFL